MRILIDLSILRHPYCGLGQVALNYGRWYGEHAAELFAGHEITLLVPKDYVGGFGTGVRYLEARDAYRFVPWLMPRFDVWHSIHQLSPFAPCDGRTRRVLTIHDVNFIHEKRPSKQRKYLRRLQRECDRASTICFISQYARSDASKYLDLNGKPVHVIMQGVGDLTKGEQARPAGVEEGRPFFLNINVVKAKKNVQVLLPLMERLKEYQLIVAGDDSDPYAQGLRSQMEGMENVRMIGSVSAEERCWLYAHCRGVFFPSLYEGFGMPVIEAMQWGKPVFCSNRSSLPEVGGEMAYYFTDFDADRMAEVVRNGLADFSEERAAEEQRYAAGFSFDRHLRQYVAILTNKN